MVDSLLTQARNGDLPFIYTEEKNLRLAIAVPIRHRDVLHPASDGNARGAAGATVGFLKINRSCPRSGSATSKSVAHRR
jgi:hypothetical protein